MKALYLDVKKKIYRSTQIMFVVQLFGALGAGFFFFAQNIVQNYHWLGALSPDNEPTLWFILFWGTDFFFVAMTLVLSYLIAGIPAIAPSLALSIYFCHFRSASVGAEDMYSYFFATPNNYSQATSIGYMGYLIMAVILAVLIKYLYIGWTNWKPHIGNGIDKLLANLRKKIKAIPADLKGLTVVEAVDLIVMILILPVASCATTFCLIKYGIEIPFAALADKLTDVLTSLAGSNVILMALVMGLMVGFDLVGPLSMAAYGVATAAYLQSGNAQLITIYSACFITVGWTAFFGVMCCKIFKKGGHVNTDDFNITSAGPVNAFFENIKLTVAFSMPYAYRSPLTVIPGLMAGSGVAGLLTAVFGIVNTAYTDGSLPKYTTGNYTYGGVDYTYAELFEHKEIYMSFTLPLRSGDWLTCRIPLALIILAGGIVGGLVIMALKEGEYRFLTKRGCYYQDDGDMVLEIREFGKKLAKSVRKKPAAETAGAGAPDEAADGVPVMPEVKASMEESRQEAEKK